MYAGVRRRPDYKLSRRKQGFEFPRERHPTFGSFVLRGRASEFARLSAFLRPDRADQSSLC